MAEEQDDSQTFSWTSLERDDTANFVKSAGRARVVYANGDTYEGPFNELKQRHGRGVYTWNTKVGANPWVPEDGYPEGAAPAVRYDGDYVEGRKSGVGKLSLPNGDRYNGFFEGDRFHGDGSYFYRGGDVYSGSWQRGVKHGSGTFLTSTDGSQLTGTWFRGSMVSGKWIWADGTVWLGTFRDSRPLGRGVFYFPNGTQQEGEYVLAAGEEGGESEGAFPVWKGGPFAAASLPASEVIRAPLAVA